MNRTDFQELAELRLKEAEALLLAGCWDGAYYLAGYAVECGLKACIAKRTRAEEFPPDRRTVESVYSHNLLGLLKAVKMDGVLTADASVTPALQTHWATTENWSEQSRYERTPEAEARALYRAIADPTFGVLQWIKRYW